MKLITKEIRETLLANGRKSRESDDFDPAPVLKLFTPWAGATWLITELDPEDELMAFGLCDLGLGSPELGYVWLPEVIDLRGPFGLTVERDLWFTGDKPISAYADEARARGSIAA
jgi:hypothetical protein